VKCAVFVVPLAGNDVSYRRSEDGFLVTTAW